MKDRNQLKREIFYYRNYYLEFFNGLKPGVQRKFNWTLQLLTTLDKVPEKYFKHLEGTKGIFEIRVEYESNTFRVFFFFDEGNLIILINGLHKKTQKTPIREMEKAKRIRKSYYDEKGK